jgi:hypothetical protein
MERLAGQPVVGKNAPVAPAVGPTDPLPPAYCDAVLRDAGADARQPGPSIRTQPLAQIACHLLRVTCSKCLRIVEIQNADAVRLYGPQEVWKDCAQRLLDDTCQARTGRLEEDGCWPMFE